MHLEKFKRGSVRAVLRHDLRTASANALDGHINAEETCKNYNILDGLEPYGRLRTLMAQAKTVRANTNIVCSWVVTLPKDYCGSPKAFFEASTEFFKHRYGAENALSACVHMDEATPHLHYKFVPLTADGRISAKEIITRKELIAIHREMEQYLSANLGESVHLINGATARGNYSVQDLKAQAKADVAYYVACTDACERMMASKSTITAPNGKTALLSDVVRSRISDTLYSMRPSSSIAPEMQDREDREDREQ